MTQVVTYGPGLTRKAISHRLLQQEPGTELRSTPSMVGDLEKSILNSVTCPFPIRAQPSLLGLWQDLNVILQENAQTCPGSLVSLDKHELLVLQIAFDNLEQWFSQRSPDPKDWHHLGT